MKPPAGREDGGALLRSRAALKFGIVPRLQKWVARATGPFPPPGKRSPFIGFLSGPARFVTDVPFRCDPPSGKITADSSSEVMRTGRIN
jgi:hypothetical protein